jgi:two-component sensor histidine kinase
LPVISDLCPALQRYALKLAKTKQQNAIRSAGHSLQQGLKSPIHLKWSYGMDPTVSATPEDTTSLTLVAEISHRVLNEYTHAIASLSLAAADTTNIDARHALTMAARRLRHYADVHRALRPPCGLGQADLGEYLKTLCTAHSLGSLRDRAVQLTFIQRESSMEADRCWRVGLIVSELVTNATEHAFAGCSGAIVVELFGSGGLIYCRVSDNGRAASYSPRPGRGCAIVEGLTRELGGQVEWSFSPEGTTVVLAVPSEAGPSEESVASARNNPSRSVGVGWQRRRQH